MSLLILLYEVVYRAAAAAAAAKSLQLCLTLCDPIDGSPPGSSVHEIFQARILEWVAISFSRASYQPKDLLHCRQILYRLSYKGSRRLLLSHLTNLESKT